MKDKKILDVFKIPFQVALMDNPDQKSRFIYMKINDNCSDDDISNVLNKIEYIEMAKAELELYQAEFDQLKADNAELVMWVEAVVKSNELNMPLHNTLCDLIQKHKGD